MRSLFSLTSSSTLSVNTLVGEEQLFLDFTLVLPGILLNSSCVSLQETGGNYEGTIADTYVGFAITKAKSTLLSGVRQRVPSKRCKK